MQFRSTTDEMLAARFDPEPWVDPDGTRHVTGGWSSAHAPRPEFIPTRDPEPWVSWGVLRCATRQSAGCYFDPRPEYARPEPNPILVDMRKYRAERLTMNNPKGWDHVLRRFEHAVAANPWGATPAQIEHARKVLTRLVNMSKED